MLVKILIRNLDTGALYSKTISHQKPYFTIGRVNSDITIKDKMCSRFHAVINEVPGEGFILRDSGSLNGTYVNDLSVQVAKIKPGDQIKIGSVILSIVSAVTNDEQRRAQREIFANQL